MSDTRLQFLEHVRDVWAHLPVFRAVAETEHLPTAARALELVPSSLSRSIRQLEDILGVEVFDHSSKTLVLNEHGRQLLTSVRAAMRLIDDGVRAVRGQEIAGVVTVAIASSLSSSLVAPACARLARSHPELGVSTLGVAEHAIDAVLLRGGADAAVVTRPDRDPALTVTELAIVPRAVYAARDSNAGELPFVAIGSRTDVISDGWPAHHTRTIAMWTHCERVALEMCLSGQFAFITTESNVAPYRAQLRTLPIDVSSLTLYLVTRKPVGSHPRTELLVSALRAGVATRAR